ncbi:hypothetical protein ON010_g2764 [Phytophthora cinnamomi]|nr:hypothetical protein ON010_g2764 [Phytophthora cinnamomi]
MRNFPQRTTTLPASSSPHAMPRQPHDHAIAGFADMDPDLRSIQAMLTSADTAIRPDIPAIRRRARSPQPSPGGSQRRPRRVQSPDSANGTMYRPDKTDPSKGTMYRPDTSSAESKGHSAESYRRSAESVELSGQLIRLSRDRSVAERDLRNSEGALSGRPEDLRTTRAKFSRPISRAHFPVGDPHHNWYRDPGAGIVEGRSPPSWASTATAGGLPLARTNSADETSIDITMEVIGTVPLGGDNGEDRGSDGGDAKAKFGKAKLIAELLSGVGEISPLVGYVCISRPAQRNFAAGFGDDADDDIQDVAPGDRPPLLLRAMRASSGKSPNWELLSDTSWGTLPFDCLQ